MGATMLPLLALLLWAAATTTQANDDCPQEKTVGGVCFTRVAEDVDTSEYNCTGSCSYQDGHGDKYCFKAGPYKVEDTCPAPTTPELETETETEGGDCNRDCINDTTNKICKFTFTLEQRFSDWPGRLADGKVRPILVYNGQLPGPTIAVCEGDAVVMTLKNRLNGDSETLLGSHAFNSTTLHFHGIREKQPVSVHPGWTKYGPWSDGVPRVTQCPTPAGEDFTYFFRGNWALPGGPGGINADYNNAPAGTYWYHSHVGTQRMNGAAGKLIIMPRTKSDRVDVDLPENSLFLQEWYPSIATDTPTNILVNGKSKQHQKKHTMPADVDKDDWIERFKMGKKVDFITVPNDDYNPATQADYEVFTIQEPGSKYRFRIIGGIGDYHPIRLSVEDHTFTVIAADSIDVESVSGLEALWVANGERYDIVIDTKLGPKNSPYKIYFYSPLDKTRGICSLAWLKYPGQTVNTTIEADCPFIGSLQFTKVLNPVPTNFSDWGNPNFIYPINLTAVAQAETIDNLKPFLGVVSTVLNTQYLSMSNMMFNNYSMAYAKDYPEVPFLFQSPTNHTGRCGVNCELKWWFKTECTRLKPDGCGTQQPPNQLTPSGFKKCHCPHVIQEPWVRSGNLVKYWFEIVLINIEGETVPHPIHMHGGWYNIVGMGQFDKPIFRDTIMDMDRKGLLPRNFDHPVFKDVIQVPTNGYVIFRVPVDNQGTWIVHCHINYHVEHGMAMIFQIGKANGWRRWSMGPDETTAQNNMNKLCP